MNMINALKGVFPGNLSRGQGYPSQLQPPILRLAKVLYHPYLFSFINHCGKGKTRKKNNESKYDSSLDNRLLRNELSKNQRGQYKFADIIKSFCKIFPLSFSELHLTQLYQESFRSSRIFISLILSLVTGYSLLVTTVFAGANPNWGAANVQRKVAIQSGGGQTTAGGGGVVAGNSSTEISVWSDVSRSNITNGAVNMTATGDGTYEYNVKLARGATYNFILFVRTGDTPPNGLNPNSDYFDTAHWSTNTYMPTSTSSTTYNPPSEPLTSVCRFKQVGPTNDSRRVITVPRSLAASSTLYVFCNYASTPTPPINFQAQPSGATSVDLSWGKPFGVWGSGSDSFAAADVIAGGVYMIRHSTGSSTGPYEDLVTLPGSSFTYTRTGLTSGQTYYYIIRSSDAYQGKLGTADVPNHFSDFSASTANASPQASRRIRFKVENIDWEKVEGKFQNLVWMTPWDEEARDYPYKEPGRIVRVYLPPAKEER